MGKEFIQYEQALTLKELGFNEPCFAWYGPTGIFNDWDKTDTIAPLYQQAFRWFREKYNLFGCIDLHVCTPAHWYIRVDDIILNDYVYHSEDEDLRFNSYEEAELACLKKLIELVKNNTGNKKNTKGKYIEAQP
jgi:hypothetical protein